MRVFHCINCGQAGRAKNKRRVRCAGCRTARIKEQHAAADSRRYWADPEKSRTYKRERMRAWVAKNPGRKAELTRTWRRANPIRTKITAIVREEARERGVPPAVIRQEWRV